jgi:hypothetical protein
MKIMNFVFLSIIIVNSVNQVTLSQTSPDKINFVRQGVQRMIFDEDQSIPLASLEPDKIIGISECRFWKQVMINARSHRVVPNYINPLIKEK